jgi:NAD(P)-dependent dehydrogenase (short-subunit alcohol dehydrogenase family)
VILEHFIATGVSVLVIGATGGIGSATALAFSRRGFRIRALHRRPQEAASKFARLNFDADIARELRMSPANVYRFFANKSDVTEAVCMDLLRKIEAEAELIAVSRDTAAQRIRNLIGTVETAHLKQYMRDRKLYDLIEASITKKWESGRRHTERMTVASGMASGEFSPRDATFATRLVNTACIRFRDPRLIVEHEQEPEPTLDQMISFCIAGTLCDRVANDPAPVLDLRPGGGRRSSSKQVPN